MVEWLKSANAPQWGAEFLNFQRYMLDPMPTLTVERKYMKLHLKTNSNLKFQNFLNIYPIGGGWGTKQALQDIYNILSLYSGEK